MPPQTTLLMDAVISMIRDKLVGVPLHMHNDKKLWDAHKVKFSVTDSSSELYAMEQFHDYRMVDNRPVVEQAHGIECIVKKLKLLKCVCYLTICHWMHYCYLTPWRNFVHQIQDIYIENLIGSLGVEENKVAGRQSSVNVVHKNPMSSNGKTVVIQTTKFRKKQKQDKDMCYVCGEPSHWAVKCPFGKGVKGQSGQNSKLVNQIIGNNDDVVLGYGNVPIVLYSC